MTVCEFACMSGILYTSVQSILEDSLAYVGLWPNLRPHLLAPPCLCLISGWKQTNVMPHPLCLPYFVLSDFFPFLKVKKFLMGRKFTVMHRITTGIRSEKRIFGRFRHVNVKECTYANLDGIAYCTPRLNGIAYCS